MWVNRLWFETVTHDNKYHQELIQAYRAEIAEKIGTLLALQTQKAKDDVTIDWMRHRINALEKQVAILTGKATGLNLPVPEIVPASSLPTIGSSYQHIPVFEDMGDEAARAEGVSHDEDGKVLYR